MHNSRITLTLQTKTLQLENIYVLIYFGWII